MANRDFSSRWHNLPVFDVPEPAPTRCPFAQDYRDWAEGFVRPLQVRAGVVAINQAKVVITDRYFSWRAAVPKAHRDRLICSGGSCLLAQFTEFYELLLALELSLAPPPLSLPPAPKRVPKAKRKAPSAPDFYVPEDEDHG